MTEWLKLYDERGVQIGEVERGEAHRLGRWHKSVHVWVVNDGGEILLQHRCMDKKFFPNCWDCAFAGHVEGGESSITTAIREGKEEIGLALLPEELEFLFTYKDVLDFEDKINKEFVDVFLVRKNVCLQDLVLQREEVDDVKYMSGEEFFDKILKKKGDFLFHGEEEYVRLKEILAKKGVQLAVEVV